MFFFVSFIATLALAVQAMPVAPVARAALDVWVPHILTPNAETVWTIGEPANVTWYADPCSQHRTFLKPLIGTPLTRPSTSATALPFS